MNDIMNALSNNVIGSPVAPTLTPQLSLLYSSLTPELKKAFTRVFTLMWNELLPLRAFTGDAGLLHSYYIVDMLREHHNLTDSQLAVLSFVYQVTRSGASVIHSDVIKNNPLILPHIKAPAKQACLTYLKKRGFIKRLRRDPASPYLARTCYKNPVYIQLTLSGAGVIRSMQKDLHRHLYNISFNELTGSK